MNNKSITIQPSHKMDMRQAASWAYENEKHDTYAVYSTAYRGGEHKEVSGKVFCLGSWDQCRKFLTDNAEQAEVLSLEMADLDEVGENLYQGASEPLEQDYRCEAWA